MAFLDGFEVRESDWKRFGPVCKCSKLSFRTIYTIQGHFWLHCGNRADTLEGKGGFPWRVWMVLRSGKVIGTGLGVFCKCSKLSFRTIYTIQGHL